MERYLSDSLKASQCRVKHNLLWRIKKKRDGGYRRLQGGGGGDKRQRKEKSENERERREKEEVKEERERETERVTVKRERMMRYYY